MKLATIDPNNFLNIEQIFDTLELNGIEVTDAIVAADYVTINHNLSVDEFENLIMVLATHHYLQPQDPDWFPGTPTGDPVDYGYYVCPITAKDWYEGDFNMLITTDAIHWC